MNKLIFILCVCFFSACVETKIDLDSMFKKAKQSKINGQTDSALYIYNDIISYDSTFFKAYIEIGYIMTEKNNFNEAVKYFQKAIFYGAEGYRPFYYLGGSYMKLGQMDSARVWMEKSLQYKPDDPLVMALLSEIYASLKQFEKALKINNKLIEMDKNSPAGYVGRGGTYGMMGLHDKEIEDFKKAIELDTAGKTEALVDIAYTYHYAMNDNAKACEYLKLAEKKIGYKPTEKELKDFCRENL